MRILFLTHFFPPERNAGTENYTIGLASFFKNRGNDVEVVCAGSWEKGESYWNGVAEDSIKGINVHRIQLNWKRANDPNSVTYQSDQVEEWMDRFLEENKPDLVHVTSTMTLGVGVLRATKRAGIPLVLTLMDFWFVCPRTTLLHGDGQLCDGIKTAWDCQQCLMLSSRIYRYSRLVIPEKVQPAVWTKIADSPVATRRRGFRGLALNMDQRKDLMREVLELPDVILTHSKFVKETFAQTDLLKRTIHLSNGHDLSWLKNFNGNSKSTLIRFGYMGQLIRIKGVDILLKAFISAGLDGQAKLDVWGDLSSDEHYAQELSNLSNNSKSIRLRGRFDRDQLATVLADIDILVVPSLWYENAPLVIYEAFAAKTPVIAADLGGMAEAIAHEVNGLLFERANVDELTLLLKRFVEEPDLIKRLQAGIPLVKTIEEEGSDLESIYQELTNRIS